MPLNFILPLSLRLGNSIVIDPDWLYEVAGIVTIKFSKSLPFGNALFPVSYVHMTVSLNLTVIF